MRKETSSAGSLEGIPVWVNDSNKTWPSLRIAETVPLGRIEWLWKSRGTSIRDSSTSARALFEVSNTHSESIPSLRKFSHEWYRNPYVYILVTTVKELDDSKDIITWERIRRFLDSCREELHEYLIIVAASEAELTNQRRIIDKLRTEVNLVARGRERVVLVPPASIREEIRPITHLHHSPSHQDLLVRLRECMRDAVEARIRSYEDEVSRSYLSRSGSAWSFSKFFALKEGMSFVFVQLGRRDVAVKLYDELSITMTEANYLSARNFCNLGAAEAARGVSNPDEKNYRSLLVDDSATELDIRTYLFARQISLLLVDRKFSDVAERGLKFVTAIARRCAEESLKGKEGFSATFRDTWVFTSSRALAASLAPAIPSYAEASHALSAQLSTARERHTARLIAGFHVHALKAFLGLAHVALPGCLSPEDSSLVEDRDVMIAEVKLANDEELKNALSDRKKAELLHTEIANAAASLYEMGGRPRGAAALDGDAGMACMRNKGYNNGESLLAAQCSRFTNDNGWDELHRRPRLELANAEKELHRVEEYLVSCLTMLYMTRESRLGSLPTGSSGERDTASPNADVWMKETLQTAANLPRVMKYRADRLFHVSVRPSAYSWNEGDSGSAIVQVKSDLPISISVDRVIMECRSADIDIRRKSAFVSRSQCGSRPSSPKGNQLMNSPSSKTNAATSERPDTFSLFSKEKITINPEVNLIPVSGDEVPDNGLFKVTSVALFLGNLKLVQGSARVPTHPVVTTRQGAAGKVIAGASSTTMLADLANCEVRFPIFVAFPRKPSASLVVKSHKHLYLAPRSVQYVQIRIQASEHGVIKGAKLRCSLLNANGTSTGPDALVQFADVAQALSDNATYVLPIIPTNETSNIFDVGEAVLDRELGPNEVIETQIALHVSSEEGRIQQDVDEDPNCFSITMHIQLSCREKTGSRNRLFTCESEDMLSFAAPVSVSAHTQMHSTWGGDTVSRAVALDGTPLTDGGSLLCSVTSRVRSGDTLILKQATLETPSWLELRPDEAPTHEDILPAELGPCTSFSCVFDVLEREEDSLRYHGQLSNSSEPFDTEAMQRRASRKYGSTSGLTKNEEDSQDWKYEPPSDDSSSSSDGLMEQVTFVMNNATSLTDDGHEGTRDEDNRVSNIPDDLDTISGREAQDVVDLSASREQNDGLSTALGASPMLSRDYSMPQDIATLRLYVEISGVKGVSCLERQICMESFRTARKRFRIERSIDKVGKSGDVMKLDFEVRSVGERRSYYYDAEEETTLQFEVDADPEVWLVVGKRRGKLMIDGDSSAAESVNLIPLTCGWHHVPCLRLFTMDGQALPFSRYENMDECKDVVLLPCTVIVGGCAIDDVNKDSGGINGKGNMPVVIASDSFFGS